MIILLPIVTFSLDYVLIFRVCFFTKVVQDQIKNLDHKDFSLRKETMYPKRDYFSFISIETTHNIDRSPEIRITRLSTVLQVCWSFIVFWMIVGEPNDDKPWNKIWSTCQQSCIAVLSLWIWTMQVLFVVWNLPPQ